MTVGLKTARSNLDGSSLWKTKSWGQLLINECIKATIEERWCAHFKESSRETKRHKFQEFPSERVLS
jgi:hypothetical protein